MNLQDLMLELAQAGIESTLGKVNDEVVLSVSGFSKAGTARLTQRDGYVLCETRYGRVAKITCLEDLVEEAWYWYVNYSERPPFTVPHYHWLPQFLSRGWVAETTAYKVTRDDV